MVAVPMPQTKNTSVLGGFDQYCLESQSKVSLLHPRKLWAALNETSSALHTWSNDGQVAAAFD